MESLEAYPHPIFLKALQNLNLFNTNLMKHLVFRSLATPKNFNEFPISTCG